MKRYMLYAAVLLPLSCTGELRTPEIEDENREEVRIDTGFTALMPGHTKTMVDFASGEGVVKWLADDPVYITNGKQSANYFIKTGGSTSSPLYTKDKALDGDKFFAVYPYAGASYEDNVFTSSIPVNQSYRENGFSTATFPMVAVCGEDRVLNFKNAAALLKLVPSAEWSSKLSFITVTAEKPLAGEISIAYTGDADVPEVTCTGSNSVSVNCSGVELGEPVYVVVAPGSYEQMSIAVTLANGLTVTVPQTEVIKVDRSKYASLGLDLKSQFTDLSAEGTANCYLLKTSGSYCFNASVRGNGVATSCGLPATNEDAQSVTEYFHDGETFISGSFSYMDGYIYFSTVDAESLPVGTSLISLKNSIGQTIWSWHLWANPEVKDMEVGGYTWMNMNLGAHTLTWNDEGYMGYYYQWGRKDPMMQQYSQAGDFKNPWASHASLIDGSIENSILNPTYFYGSYFHSSDKDNRISDWTFYSDDMSKVVWDWWCLGITGPTTTGTVTKTMWDPCPVGYHVPEPAAFNALAKGKVDWDAFDEANHSHKMGEFVVPTLSYRGVGVTTSYWKGSTADTPAYLWSAFPATATGKGKVNAYRVWGRNQSSGISEIVRAYGSPVRCIKEK